MRATVGMWGNSFGVRLPRALAEEVGLREGSPIEVQVVDGVITIRPNVYTLEGLLAGITKDNLHDEIHVGPPRGREIW